LADQETAIDSMMDPMYESKKAAVDFAESVMKLEAEIGENESVNAFSE
jgi:hypothetical protein